MRILYGSQNFGYDTPVSDKDWVEILIPDWDDILNLRALSNEIIEADNSHLKQRDIRVQLKLFKNGHFNSYQLLYSKVYIGCDDFKWFLDNRERIVRHNIYQSYLSNSRNILGMLSGTDYESKPITRAYVMCTLLKRLLSSEEFRVYCDGAREYRDWLNNIDKDKRKEEAEKLVNEIKGLECEFERFKDVVDTSLIKDMDAEVCRLIKNKLNT